MKKAILTAFLSMMFLAGMTQSEIPVWKMTDYQHYVQSDSGKILVINFWATFCKPCIAEIPGFTEVVNTYKDQGVTLLLVSLDMPSFYPAKILRFVKEHSFTAPVVWLDETDADYFCPLVDKRWSGSIPATLILNQRTGYRKFMEGEMEKAEFETEIRKAITGTPE